MVDPVLSNPRVHFDVFELFDMEDFSQVLTASGFGGQGVKRIYRYPQGASVRFEAEASAKQRGDEPPVTVGAFDAASLELPGVLKQIKESLRDEEHVGADGLGEAAGELRRHILA